MASARENSQRLSDELTATKNTLHECQSERDSLKLALQENRKASSVNSKISDQLRKASVEAKELVKTLEMER